jgi:hypothetical protein
LNFSLPYSRRRRYLTGIDWVVGALHEAARATEGVGAVSQAILEVEDRLDERRLRDALDRISLRLPLIHGWFSRDWLNLAPYWKVPPTEKCPPIPLRVVDLDESASPAEMRRYFDDHVNQPFASDTEHLRLLLVRAGSRLSHLGVMFDHRLLDALGAETFFRLLNETDQGRLDAAAGRIRTTEPAHLDHWPRRFASGKKHNQMLIEMQEHDICALRMPAEGRRRRVRFAHESLTNEQTAGLNTMAFSEIGVPILLPSAASRAVAAVREAIPHPPLSGSQYLLFTSANMRPPGQEWETMFFNHFSFLPLTVDSIQPVDLRAMADALREQFFGYVKDQLPFMLQDAAALGRIFPRTLIARIINSMFKQRMCSFYFACVKESGFASTTFMDLPARNLIHTPAAFIPPGVNLCMTSFAGRFNLTLSYIEGVMDDATAGEIVARFKSSLIGEAYGG